MSADNYLINDQNEVYFLTFTVADWIDAHQTTGNLNYDGYECFGLQTRKQLTPRYKRGAGGKCQPTITLSPTRMLFSSARDYTGEKGFFNVQTEI